ncbi:MAG: electron transfer flavoprotein subunit beta/FixA family protein [Proteobacteria bacterium]|nr:electron transfer flavoprotein subunit beta/FixA family protein [Pseudomonadota bacterium]
MSTPAIPSSPSILVCVKFVPDPAQLQADAATGRPDLKQAPFRISTFDENALEAALRLVAEHGGRAVALSVCAQLPPRDVVLKVLAMGMAAVYVVSDPQRLARDPLRVATVLAAAARAAAAREGIAQWDLVISGEASADEFNQQVGPRLAAALDLPLVTYATALALDGGVLRAERGVEDRSETLEVGLPALATVGTEINTARMPTVLQIMGAGRKPVVELALDELPGLDAGRLKALPEIELLEVFSPPSARKKTVIKGESADEVVGELLRRLGADGEVTF